MPSPTPAVIRAAEKIHQMYVALEGDDEGIAQRDKIEIAEFIEAETGLGELVETFNRAFCFDTDDERSKNPENGPFMVIRVSDWEAIRALLSQIEGVE
ncbi:MAG: hypothetical protein WC455_12350 [Dehalococcoidia bacterium]|jgi:hypothetical protein